MNLQTNLNTAIIMTELPGYMSLLKKYIASKVGKLVFDVCSQ